jgi:hypothetical protein
LRKLIHERRVKVDRSQAAQWRPHPEDAELFDAAAYFYRLDPATAP